VGRPGSPVLDHYPPKDPELSLRGPPAEPVKSKPSSTISGPATSAVASSPSELPPATGKPEGLISLERPFDPDEFAQLLGENQIRVTVPRDALAETLRRVTEFMNFGIYVYSIRVHPAPSELLKQFVLELQRVDFSPAKKAWVPFQEQGASDSPFGPSGSR
jgi:hypothetical protein